MKITEETYTDSEGNTYTRRTIEGASIRIRDTESGTTYECYECPGVAEEGKRDWMLTRLPREFVALWDKLVMASSPLRVVCTLYGDGELLVKLGLIAFGHIQALEGYSGPALTGVEMPIEDEDLEEPPPPPPN